MGKMKKIAVMKASVGEVWKMFAYPENVLKIFEELKSYEVLSKKRIGLGATYKWVARYFGKDFELIEKLLNGEKTKNYLERTFLAVYYMIIILIVTLKPPIAAPR